MMDAKERAIYLKEKFNMEEHPEGGSFSEVYSGFRILSKSEIIDAYGDIAEEVLYLAYD
ncbi:MAG: hypothetical protein J6H21_06940 [Firmicutes bacterium]|nr:hypothetical protein [Bacillota bacterium]